MPQSSLDTYLDLLELTLFEADVAFEDLADENVWRRPDERLPSVGELAGHVVFWMATRFAGEGAGGPDLSKCSIESPLVDPVFRYYDQPLSASPREGHRQMTAVQVKDEFMRVCRESMAQLKAKNPELDAPMPGWESDQNFSTLREALKYQVFHVSYHVGQIYTTRHLLGDNPPDN
jgi:hypothetical protein